MRLLLDEHFARSVAEGLAARGVDAVRSVEAGLRTLEDEAVWRWAITDGRVMVTYDREDYLALFARFYEAGVHHPGLVLVDPRSIGQADIGGLVHALESLAASGRDLTDQVIFLTRAASAGGP